MMWWDFPYSGYGWLMSWCVFLFPLFFLAYMVCMYRAYRRRFSFSMCCSQDSTSLRQLSAELNSMREEIQALRKEITKSEGFM
ncbi:hypothetical protein SPSIL_036310 [Sporomusa silvacetica DSM 10669]|uniref:Uncharacterized protein n=1 Tax=Sporomusa silvacetica DSM 10669 TaxID=1123289 RepID=A0ABZ3IP30_9FIRM|nr:hypothetical protein SPSIL_17370 [Sporomusa silvacetica DSM 10669]